MDPLNHQTDDKNSLTSTQENIQTISTNMPPPMIKIKHSLQGLMVQYETAFANWVELPFPIDMTFGAYTKLMAKNLGTIGLAADANLHMFIKPGGSSAGFTPTPDQTLGDLSDLFKNQDGILIVDIAAQPMYG